MPWNQPRKRRPQGHTGKVESGRRTLFSPVVRPTERGVAIELPGQVTWDLPAEAARAFAARILSMCDARPAYAVARPLAPPQRPACREPEPIADPTVAPPFVPGSFGGIR
jgi:hypothetical protein